MIIILSFFIYFLWKIPLIGFITKFLFGTKPNLQGTWLGKLNYNYEKKGQEKDVFLVIEQKNGYSMNIWLLTNERKSSSTFSEITLQDGSQRIIYTYKHEKALINKEKNPPHEGFCYLDIDMASKILSGKYFTDRETFGELKFDRRNGKVVKNYDAANRLFKMCRFLKFLGLYKTHKKYMR